jgi:hypothetical protein
MTAESIGEVVEQAVEATGQSDVPVEHCARLLTDRGPVYVAHAFEDHLRMVSIGTFGARPIIRRPMGRSSAFIRR